MKITLEIDWGNSRKSVHEAIVVFRQKDKEEGGEDGRENNAGDKTGDNDSSNQKSAGNTKRRRSRKAETNNKKDK
jgi:hypothetical protein